MSNVVKNVRSESVFSLKPALQKSHFWFDRVNRIQV